MAEDDQLPYTFFARVIPERFSITLRCPRLQLTMPDVGRMVVLTQIEASQVVCKVKLLEGSMNLNSLRNFVESHIRALVDFAGYDMKIVLDVDVISVTRDNGLIHFFQNDMIELIQTGNRYPEDPVERLQMLMAVTAEPHAISVLASFREAMLIRRDAGLFCYRAIESMMQSMRSAPNSNHSREWDKLREMLCVKRETIDFIKSHADSPRHGKLHNISGEDTKKIYEITDEIISRYFKYLVSEKKKLSSDEYSDF